MRTVTRVRAAAGLVAGILALVATDVGAQTYRWVDEKGGVHYVQGVDNVPERYRDPRLSPGDREAAGSDEDRTAALQLVWRCASDQIVAAEALTLKPGGGPWAERVRVPAKPS